MNGKMLCAVFGAGVLITGMSSRTAPDSLSPDSRGAPINRNYVKYEALYRAMDDKPVLAFTLTKEVVRTCEGSGYPRKECEQSIDNAMAMSKQKGGRPDYSSLQECAHVHGNNICGILPSGKSYQPLNVIGFAVVAERGHLDIHQAVPLYAERDDGRTFKAMKRTDGKEYDYH